MILFSQCTANLMNQEILVSKQEKKNTSTLEAVIIKIDFRNTNSENINLDSYSVFKKSLLASVYNSQIFQDVTLVQERIKRDPENTVYIDFMIQPIESGEYGRLYNSSFNFWWVMWPSIYPLTLYFPIQVKSGLVEVIIRANIDYKGSNKTIFIKKSIKYNIFLYAYFMTDPIETALKKTYEKSLNELTLKLKEIDFTKNVN